MKKNITPTKSNYSALKEELSLAKESHNLLEQKREVLIINLTNIINEIYDKRKELDQHLHQSFSLMSLVKLESGSIGLSMICNSITQDYEVEMIEHTIMGVVAPKIVFIESKTKNKSLVPTGISGTSPNLDKLIQITKTIRPLMTQVAYLESTSWKLISEINKTQRRINALENFIIPETQETMKFINNILEEKDRETLFQIKRIKANQQKKMLKETSHDV